MGGKIKLQISETNFADRINPQCELSILIGMDSLSYCISDSQRQVLLIRECDLSGFKQLGDFFLQDEYLRQTYQNVKTVIISTIFTFVPNRLYNTAEKRTYLQHVTPLKEDMNVRSDELKLLSVTNVYAIERDRLDTIQKYLPGSKVFHVTTALLQGLLSKSSPEGGQVVHIHIHSGGMTLVLLDGKSLQFVNSFLYQSAKDFLYYVMLVFDQFKLNPEETPAYISGHLIKDSEIYPLLHRYLRKLDFISPPDFLNIGNIWNDQRPHFFFDLFSISLCN